MLTAIGALLAGIGALSTWVTVGIPNESAHSAIRGVDLVDGRVVLAFAALSLVMLLASMKKTREAVCVLTSVLGLATAAIGAAFLAVGRGRSAVVQEIGIPKELWASFGVFRDLGMGAYVVVLGGVLSLVGGAVMFVSAHRGDSASEHPPVVSVP